MVLNEGFGNEAFFYYLTNFFKNMENSLANDNFYNEMSSLITPLGLKVVETRLRRLQKGVSVSVYVTKDGDVNSDDLEEIYNVVYLKLKPQFQGGLTLEISTPGVTRNIKDAGEFGLFKNREVRIYSLKNNTWVVGIIDSSDDRSVTLLNGHLEDVSSDVDANFNEKQILFSDIKKARLIDATVKEKKQNGKEKH